MINGPSEGLEPRHEKKDSITKTRLYNVDPLKPHFYIVKLEFTGYTLFSFLLRNIDCWYSLEPLRRGSSNEYPQSIFCAEIRKNVRIFVCNFHFLVIKFSVYLRLVFIMFGALHEHIIRTMKIQFNL